MFGRIFLLNILLLPICHAQNVIIWETSHPDIANGVKSDCFSQSVKRLIDIPGNFSAIKTQYPNFIFATEQSQNINSTLYFGLDDQFLNTYAGFHIQTKQLILELKGFLEDNVITSASFRNAVYQVYSYYILLLDDRAVPLIAEIAKKLPYDDSNKDLLEYIGSDYLTLYQSLIGQNKNFYQFEEAGYPTVEGPGLINSMGELMKAIEKNDLETIENSKEKIIFLTQIYSKLSERIADIYFKRHFDKKYDVTIYDPGTEWNGKKIFSIAVPNVLFSYENLIIPPREGFDYYIDASWRDHFMVQKLVDLMKKNPNGQILVWVGTEHMNGFVQRLLVNENFNLDQKSKIKFASETVSGPSACNLEEVLSTLYGKTYAPTIFDWYAALVHKPTIPLTVEIYDLVGTALYKDVNYRGRIDLIALSKLVKEKTNKNQMSTFYVRIQKENSNISLERITNF